jgi:hypothetical protein
MQRRTTGATKMQLIQRMQRLQHCNKGFFQARIGAPAHTFKVSSVVAVVAIVAFVPILC